ncbi:phospholipid/glycerol acyltransferase [Chloroherpeton thalassium ATCC 35110]|uniref:Phospholipid/glycerol acyltransferase n=1 Tax=Chloroherpeton thalassium (strain ATCC 35110 / GB-78) TaxID=517418 RepID=B3QY62_CHLT3|nr:lysophospholipid acyltransferase family protein [Chloroherpeton thalassium]ACF15028.1 phospholipid/glycerol acyltransferase [Chloroherpeton thalassium ATCC 35110]
MQRLIANILFRAVGWKATGEFPNFQKAVVIAAPHTSNWDFLIMLLLGFYAKQKFYWIGKHTLFKPPLGFVMKWLGGLPVDRRERQNTVSQICRFFEEKEALSLVITPEGTRKRTDFWKSGFYHIAVQAGVPIIFGYADFKRKTCGFGHYIMPTGNEEADMAQIREFYSGIQGKFPEQFGPVRFRPQSPE